MRLKLVGIAVALAAVQAKADPDLESLLEANPEAPIAAAATPASKPESALVGLIKQHFKVLSADQVQFSHFIETQAWEKALLQYQAAFAGTEFERDPSGRALLALLEGRSGLVVTAIEKLFSITEPKQIDHSVVAALKEVLPASLSAWNVALVDWRPDWAEVLGAAVEVKIRMRDVTNLKSEESLKALLEKVPAGSAERSQVDWNLAVTLALEGKADQAAKVIAGLVRNPKSVVSSDLTYLTAARMLFQNGYFDAAIRYYEKIGKKSDLWIEAQEEIGWAYMRKGQPQNALAVTQTLVQPTLAAQVGPEALFLRSVAQLRVCDYPAVVESLSSFPQRYKERTLALSSISENANASQVTKVLNLLKVKPVTLAELGSDAKKIPRLMIRDERLKALVANAKILDAEAKIANDVYVRSLAQTGLQAFFDSLKKTIESRAQAANASALNRVQELARNEVNETKKILDKMHIVEAEVIQQVAMADRLTAVRTAKSELKVGSTGSKAIDTLKFPAEKEVWFDELSHFKVDVKKGCQAKR